MFDIEKVNFRLVVDRKILKMFSQAISGYKLKRKIRLMHFFCIKPAIRDIFNLLKL